MDGPTLTFMKTPEYRERPEALENFKEGMKALFKVPNESVVKAEKKKKRKGKASSRAQSVRKQRTFDKD
jgi:hypothetical protein